MLVCITGWSVVLHIGIPFGVDTTSTCLEVFVGFFITSEVVVTFVFTVPSEDAIPLCQIGSILGVSSRCSNRAIFIMAPCTEFFCTSDITSYFLRNTCSKSSAVRLKWSLILAFRRWIIFGIKAAVSVILSECVLGIYAFMYM